jgi:hypothetical protein
MGTSPEDLEEWKRTGMPAAEAARHRATMDKALRQGDTSEMRREYAPPPTKKLNATQTPRPPVGDAIDQRVREFQANKPPRTPVPTAQELSAARYGDEARYDALKDLREEMD